MFTIYVIELYFDHAGDILSGAILFRVLLSEAWGAFHGGDLVLGIFACTRK